MSNDREQALHVPTNHRPPDRHGGRDKCPSGSPHKPEEVTTLAGELVGWICGECYDQIHHWRRGSNTYVSELDA